MFPEYTPSGGFCTEGFIKECFLIFHDLSSQEEQIEPEISWFSNRSESEATKLLHNLRDIIFKGGVGTLACGSNFTRLRLRAVSFG